MSGIYPPGFSARPIKIDRSKCSNRRSVSPPENVGPEVKLIFAEMARQGLRYQDLEDFSGVRRPTVKQWRRKNLPSWESLQAVLSTLGFGFVPTPCLQILPPELAGELTALAMKLGADIPTTWAALVDISAEQKLLRMDASERRAVVEAHRASLGNPKRRRKPVNDEAERVAA